ncbi:MAG TPA: molecular chaperone TorD family protein [Anaerolineales bacterium]|nr:molecular chaperone TorD family protein [Anaerolineales bacterium]
MGEAHPCLYELFAALLEYPTPALPGQVSACLDMLRSAHPGAAEILGAFQGALAGYSQPQVEELYTSTFDMQPVCYPYVGYHLFGESYKRGAFMARLAEAYRAFGYTVGTELPDHAAVILRFLSLSPEASNSDFGRALLFEGLLPALEKMSGELAGQAGNPYGAVFSALCLVLNDMTKNEVVHA